MRVYLDSNIWIYALEHPGGFGNTARTMLSQCKERQDRMISSLFVLAEVLVSGNGRDMTFLTASYNRIFASGELITRPFGLEAAQMYSRIRTGNRVTPLDAIHLSIAAVEEVDLFVTEDAKLLRLQVPGIRKIASLIDSIE